MSDRPRIRVCSLADVEPGTAKRVDIDADGVTARLAIVRIEDQWFAIDDECSHADYSLAEGEVDVEECTIECWKHGSLFSLETGEPLTLPATQSVRVHQVDIVEADVVAESEVFVTLGGDDD